MQCPCGGSTRDHQVTENYKRIGLYAKCQGCGRIEWIERPPEDQLREWKQEEAERLGYYRETVVKAPIERLLDEIEWTPAPPPDTKDDDVSYVTHSGILELGSVKFRCYQLSDGRRILDAEDVNTFIGWQ